MNKLQKLSSEELKLSFDFEITRFENREFDITIHKLLRDIKYSDRFFEWFMEDLIFLLAQNKYQLRWDVATVYFSGVKNLDLSDSDYKEFTKLLTTSVTNFDIVVKN
ncbi:hypothetical protein [Mycoplasmopsis columboralis]|uniref:Uncharacterized protein n=1 Tax=Mycoplasmopsis columboralis TaxID=171282 RepID=A0A449B6Q1_9BACT|nr:hypothetical protein [Mycoplasmopsis columboralis]VEU76286.1 Uncharacterised protein [Mycoplasmopsis columboralis]